MSIWFPDVEEYRIGSIELEKKKTEENEIQEYTCSGCGSLSCKHCPICEAKMPRRNYDSLG